MIFVAITNSRHKMFLFLVGALVILLAVWAFGINGGNEVEDVSTPMVEEVQENPTLKQGSDQFTEEKPGFIERLKSYYEGE